MDQDQKKLHEDINRIVNIKSLKEFSQEESGIPRNNDAWKQPAEKVYSQVKQKFEELLKNGKYNLVISTLKKLTEENENNNANKTE